MVNNSLQDSLTKVKELDYANGRQVKYQDTGTEMSYTFTQSGLAILSADRSSFGATDAIFSINNKRLGIQYLGFSYCRFCMSFLVSNGDVASIELNVNTKCIKTITFIPYK